MILFMVVFLFAAFGLADFHSVQNARNLEMERKLAFSISERMTNARMMANVAVTGTVSHPTGTDLENDPNWNPLIHYSEGNSFRTPAHSAATLLDPLQRYGFGFVPYDSAASLDGSIVESREYYVTRHDIIQESLGNRQRKEFSWTILPTHEIDPNSNSPCRETKLTRSPNPIEDSDSSVIPYHGPWNDSVDGVDILNIYQAPGDPWSSPYGLWVNPHLRHNAVIQDRFLGSDFSEWNVDPNGPEMRSVSPFRKNIVDLPVDVIVDGEIVGKTIGESVSLSFGDMQWLDGDQARSVRRGHNCAFMEEAIPGTANTNPFESWNVRSYGDGDTSHGIRKRTPGIAGNPAQNADNPMIGAKHFVGYYSAFWIQSSRDLNLPSEVTQTAFPSWNSAATTPASVIRAREFLTEMDENRVSLEDSKIRMEGGNWNDPSQESNNLVDLDYLENILGASGTDYKANLENLRNNEDIPESSGDPSDPWISSTASTSQAAFLCNEVWFPNGPPEKIEQCLWKRP